MLTNAVRCKVEGDPVPAIDEVSERLNDSGDQILVDLSSVGRIHPSAVAALDRLARAAEDRGIRIVLEGVSVEVYRVLKLVKLAARFSFGGM